MPKHPLRRQLERWAVSGGTRALSSIARLVPLRVLQASADAAAYLVMACSSRRQRMAEANIAAAFPELSAAERRGIRRRSVRNIARTMVEMFKLPTLPREQLLKLVVAQGWEPLYQAATEGYGAIVITAHFGNWELMGAIVSECIAPLTVVARDEGAGASEWILNRARRSHGTSVLGRVNMREMLRVLKSGGLLGILPDQHAAVGGQHVDFLGRPAWTSVGPARLAAHAGARVFAGFCVRDFNGGLFQVKVWPEIQLANTGDREADVTENTRRINAVIGEAIRAHPDNWLWLHNRWKTARPPAPTG